MHPDQFEEALPPFILEKIKRGQRYINTNLDLSAMGYVKHEMRTTTQKWENVEERYKAGAKANEKRSSAYRHEANAKRHWFKHEFKYILDKDSDQFMSCLSGTTRESEALVVHHVIYDRSTPQFYTIALTSSEHRQLHAGTLTEENLKRLKLALINREYIVESPEIPQEGNLVLRYPVSINIESKGAK
jgi:hypothetical protein